MPEHSIELYIALKKKGVPCMLFLHQGGHGGEPPFPLMNRWFTHFLFGVDNGVEKEAKAWIVRERAEGEKHDPPPTQYADYPNPDAAPVAVYPSGEGNKVGDLGLDAKSRKGELTLVDDWHRSGKELATADASDNRLLFATPVLSEPVHLSGELRMQIRVAADKPACNLSVWLVTLTGDEPRKAGIITRGWADPQNSRSLRESKPLEPGKFVDLKFDLNPDDQIVPEGERIGLMIFASDKEFTLHPKPGTKLTVDLAGTALTLPVVGGPSSYAQATSADGGKR
jgi:X-Pro dipeptidyl-peptidase